MSRLMGPAVLLAGCTAFYTPVRSQEAGGITAEEAMENYRAAWSLDEPVIDACAEAAADPNTIVVCRRRVDPEKYMVEREPEYRVGADVTETASGAPRAPDFNDSCLHNRGRPNCNMFGGVPAPVIMVDVEAFPEPLSPEDAAKVFAAPKASDEARQTP